MSYQRVKDRLLMQIAALDEREKEMKLSEFPQDQELTNFFANKIRQELGTK